VERVEEYLEAIYDIQEKEKRVAKTSDLAKTLKVKPSSVTEMLIKLKEKGYVEYQPYYGVSLTKKGEDVARRIKRYYTVFYVFFRDFLGIDDETAAKLSCELEHHLNDEAVEKVCNIIAGECEICDECDFGVIKLSEVKDGVYEVVATPSKLSTIGILPGKKIVVRDGKIIVDGESFDFSEEILNLVLVKS
jgi:DtxR family Mn-dependent transcriptional regulator